MRSFESHRHSNCGTFASMYSAAVHATSLYRLLLSKYGLSSSWACSALLKRHNLHSKLNTAIQSARVRLKNDFDFTGGSAYEHIVLERFPAQTRFLALSRSTSRAQQQSTYSISLAPLYDRPLIGPARHPENTPPGLSAQSLITQAKDHAGHPSKSLHLTTCYVGRLNQLLLFTNVTPPQEKASHCHRKQCIHRRGR